jgi:hypothetical protein
MQLRRIFVYLWMFHEAAALALPGSALPNLTAPAPRARVVIAQSAGATIAFEPQPDVVQKLVDNGVIKLTGKPDLKEAWLSLVSTKDVIGLKVFSGPGANSGTRPVVVGAVIEGLLQAGIPASHIIIWDKRLLDLRLAGYDDLARQYHVQMAGAADAGFDDTVFYDNPIIGTLVAGDLEFDRSGKTSGRNSYLSKLVTKTLTKIITISPLLNHNFAGVCGNLYGLAIGSVDNTGRFEGSSERLATAVPEIYAKPALSDHVVLNITDALIGQYQGEQLSLLHYSAQLNQLWFSKDPVALDVLAIKELERERQDKKLLHGNDNSDLYKNASVYLELGIGDPSRITVESAPE